MAYKKVYLKPGKGSSFIITLKLGKEHFTEEQIAKDDTETIQQTETIVPSVEIIPDSEWKEEDNKRIEDAKMLIVEDNESAQDDGRIYQTDVSRYFRNILSSQYGFRRSRSIRDDTEGYAEHHFK